MNIKCIAVGTKMSAWIEQGFREYVKRLPKTFSLSLIELPTAKIASKTSSQQLKEIEGKSILNKITHKDHVVLLDVKGAEISTEKLAETIENWQQIGKDVVIVIGGPEGVSQEVLNRADMKWSLSKLTFPHPLVRVILAEQLYRAWSITQNHPYHRP